MKFKIAVLTLFIATRILAFGQSADARIEEIIHREMLERKIPGLQIAIVQNKGIIFSKSYGIANLQDNVPVDNQTTFPINSCTKVFTGVAMMQLAEQGKINLSAPASKYLNNLPAAWQKVTIKQLLTHTSGLPNLLNLLDARTGGLGSFKNEAALWEKLISLPLDFQPGERFSYNQTNAYLLGKIIDKISEQPFVRFYAEKQFQVVGMPHTVFGDSRDVIPHFAPTYNYANVSDGRALTQAQITNNYYEFPYFRRTASGLNSSAEDLANWIVALNSNKLFKTKASLDTMWSPAKFNSGLPTPWALGWGMNKFRSRHKAVGMSGGGRAAFLVYPDDGLAVIILTNLGGSFPEDFIEEVAGCYLPDIINSDPLTFLRVNLRKTGFSHAIELTEQEAEKNPDFKINEFELNEWAYRMMAKNQLKDALEILKLEIHLFPDSWNAFDSYGEGLLKNGDKDGAVKMYKRSIELNPKNENGKRVLANMSKNL